MTNGDEQMLSRIGFAERWLTRARGQWTAGNHARSLLTLVLADAELRHAIDTAGARRRTAARQPRVTTGFLLAAVAFALLLIGRWSTTPHAVATTPPPPIVKPSVLPSGPTDAVILSARSGTSVVSVHTVVSATVAQTASSQMAVPPGPNQALFASANGPAASLRLPSRPRPSLLDLVLTAERVLRQDPAGSSLP